MKNTSGLRLLVLLSPLALFVGLLAWLTAENRTVPVESSDWVGSGLSQDQQPVVYPANKDDQAVQTAFRAWLTTYRSADEIQRTALLERGLEVAAQRRLRMARLIREEPQQALREAIRFDEYEALPEDLRGQVERPFSALVAYDYYPICKAPAGTVDHVAELSLPEGAVDTFTYGRREKVMSKRSLPVQGITLDDAAAIQEAVLHEVSAQELPTVQRLFPMAQNDPTRSFLSGKPIQGPSVIALGGGRLFAFSNRDELAEVNQAMAKLEDLPGPNAGSHVLYQAMPAAGSESGFDLAAAQSSQELLASQWTETEKRVFIIRVDFSDRTGAAYTQAEIASNLNLTVSDQIRAMSYGKTSIAAGVSANVYRMPQTSAYYINGTTGSSLNSELLRDARNTFRNTRSGADAAVDIGPVSASTNGDGGGLGTHDIVGVIFVSMNMRSSITYAGLAGGGNLWMQGNNSAGVFVHEFGHNYGVGHSGFWQTSDGSVAGAGANEEYGDPYDIMGGGDLPEGHFNPQAKARLNWLTTSDWSDATASGSGTYRIHRIDSQFTTGTPRGLRITRSAVSGNEQYFWLGYRPLYSGIPFLARGAYMVWQRPGESRSWLVDTTPATSGVKTDAPIPLGRTFVDATSNAFITPLSVGGAEAESYLDLRVNFGPYPGNSAPTAGAITGPATVAARSNASFSITAHDGNGDTLAYSWDTGDGAVNDNLSSITRSWTVGGSYTLSVTVSDMKGGTVTATKNITVTDPLNTWTQGSVGSSQYLEQLVYAKGRFISAEYFGGVFLSWDGSTWSAVGEPPDMDEPKLAFGAEVFVAAGLRESSSSTAQICWSLDGRLWQAATFPNGVPPVQAVAFGNGKFTAVGDDGTVLSSVDGKTWTVSTVSGLPDFRHVTWTGSGWVAVSMHPTNVRPEIVWTSTNGTTWIQSETLGADIYKIESYNGVCYAVGWYAGVLFSADHGLTWQEASLPSNTRWSTFKIAAASDGTLLCTARAMDESGQPAALLVSSDGQQWTRANGNTAVVNADAMAFAMGRFYTVEDGGITRRSESFSPSNAAPNVTFTSAPTTGNVRQSLYFAANATDADGDTLTYAWDFGAHTTVLDGFEIAPIFAFGGLYPVTLRVSDGRGGLTTLSHSITISDPARSFTNRSVSSTLGDFEAVASGGGRVVAVGSLFSGSFSGVRAWSTDGSTWNTGSLGSNRHLYAVTYDGTQFVGAGTRYDFTAPAGYRGWVVTSPDGVTWTERYWAGTWLYAVAYGNGVYLAAGDDGSVLRSTNGTSWSTVSISGITTSVTFEGLSWNGSVFLLTGYTGGNGGAKVLTSTNGLTWSDQSAGAGVASWQDLRKSAWLNDRFVSSGWYSKLRTSTNAGVSFTSTRNDSEETPALAYGAGIWFAAGVNRSASDADVDLLSQDGSTWFSYPAPTTNDRKAAVFFNNTFITVGVAGSIWQSGTMTGATGFPAWQTVHFPGGGVAALANRDPDDDGLSNLAEYALNLLPNSANGAFGYPVMQSGRAWLHLDVPEPAPTDVRYIIQGNVGLTGSWTELARKTGTAAWSWQAGGTSRISTGAMTGGRVPTEVGMPDAQMGQPRYFMRLVIEQP